MEDLAAIWKEAHAEVLIERGVDPEEARRRAEDAWLREPQWFRTAAEQPPAARPAYKVIQCPAN